MHYLLIILLLVFFFMNISSKSYYIHIENIYTKTKKAKMFWVSDKHKAIKHHWPNIISHDYHIKKDIIDKALQLKKNSCIIDSGAHIGDLVIPLAHALSVNDRSDIIVYAIEPSVEKCKIITNLKKKNNLTNVRVLNYALSDKNEILYEKELAWYFKLFNNSGAIEYTKEKLKNHNKIKARTLDVLFGDKEIGIIHLDVEGFEGNVLNGGKKIIRDNHPYLSIENNTNEKYKELDILPTKYKFRKRINSNNIYY